MPSSIQRGLRKIGSSLVKGGEKMADRVAQAEACRLLIQALKHNPQEVVEQINAKLKDEDFELCVIPILGKTKPDKATGLILLKGEKNDSVETS